MSSRTMMAKRLSMTTTAERITGITTEEKKPPLPDPEEDDDPRVDLCWGFEEVPGTPPTEDWWGNLALRTLRMDSFP